MLFVIKTEKILLTWVLAYGCYLPMPIVIMSLHVMGFFLLQYVKKSCGLVLVLVKGKAGGL